MGGFFEDCKHYKTYETNDMIMIVTANFLIPLIAVLFIKFIGWCLKRGIRRPLTIGQATCANAN